MSILLSLAISVFLLSVCHVGSHFSAPCLCVREGISEGSPHSLLRSKVAKRNMQRKPKGVQGRPTRAQGGQKRVSKAIIREAKVSQ